MKYVQLIWTYKIFIIIKFFFLLFKCIIPTSISDEQLLLSANDKSYDSESSPSIYLSPNSSVIDLQTMVQEFDEINNQLIADRKQYLPFFFSILIE